MVPLSYNGENGVHLFRISSDIIPFASHPVNTIPWQVMFRDQLNHLSSIIQEHSIRVSMHPGQYSVLNSPHPQIVQNTREDLAYHSRFLDSLSADPECKTILHIGGVYGNKREALLRFGEHYRVLEASIRSRVVIENDDRCFNIEDVLEAGTQWGIPVVFDLLHHLANPPRAPLSPRAWIQRCAKTWKTRDGRQKIHYSQQAPGGRPGAHSIQVQVEPFLQFYQEVNDLDLDIMLETKDKNISALKCIYCTEATLPRKYVEREWARYKYLVMSRSGSYYQEIRSLFGGPKDPSSLALNFYRLAEETEKLPYSYGPQENADLHIWGYISQKASKREAEGFFQRLRDLKEDHRHLSAVKGYLFKLSEKYQMDYLLDSYYFCTAHGGRSYLHTS